uniref:Uncharacterized protein n=1 Tax=Myoviridae sp. ct7CH26 TaxID=2827604 RepID=A0A8S5RSH6_9CAUD|nr:MAG TPA: hypothetical protein [Myoviridae sp. ct7CH26]
MRRDCELIIFFSRSRPQYLQYHAVAIKNQHPVSAGITTFGAVLGLAFGADPDTTETCGLESRSD